MSLTSNGGLTANPLDMLHANKAGMFGAGKQGFGQEGPGVADSIESLFSSNKVGVTTPTSTQGLDPLSSIMSAIVDRNPNKEAAPEAPKKSLLNSMGISFKLPQNVKSMERDGSKAIRDLGKNEKTLTSAKTDMAQQRTEAKAQFDGMKNAATALMVNEAMKDGEKPDAYIKQNIDRDSFKAETIASAFVGGKAGLVFAAMTNISTVTQESNTPNVDIDEKRSKAAQRVKDEIRARATKSDAQKIEEKQKAGVFGGGKQDVSKQDPLQSGPKESFLNDAFYESQGYKDLEKCVMDGHDIEEIMDARFEDQPEVMELDQVARDVDHVLENYDQLRHGVGVVLEAQDAYKERGLIKAPEAPAPQRAVQSEIRVDLDDLGPRAEICAMSLQDLRLSQVPAIKVAPDIKEAIMPKIETPKFEISRPAVSAPSLIS